MDWIPTLDSRLDFNFSKSNFGLWPMADSNCKINLASSLSSKTLVVLALALLGLFVCFWLIFFEIVLLLSLFLDLKDLLVVVVAVWSEMWK